MDDLDARSAPPDQSPLSDERFLLLLDTLPYPAFIIPAGGSAVHYNSVFVAYVGFRPGPLRSDRTALHHPDDQAQLIAARETGAATNSEYVVEIRLRRNDGAYRWHRIHNKPVFREGRRVAYLGTAVDIHDARTATAVLEEGVRRRTAELEAANTRLAAEEMRYRELYNQTPIALQSSSGDAKLLDVNDTWLRMFGCERAQVLGRSPADFMTYESARTYRNSAWPDMLASNGNVRIMDYQFVTASGTVFDGRLAARGVFDENGHLVRTWAAIFDITAERMAERALRQAQRLEAIGQLTAGIAHDFNNMLQGVAGGVEMARRRMEASRPAEAARYLDAARDATLRLAGLTRRLLAFAQRQRLDPRPVDADALVRGMEEMLRRTLGPTIMLELTLEERRSFVAVDPNELESALLNLCINARDAMPQGGRLTISTQGRTLSAAELEGSSEAEPGVFVEIAVADTGSGMTPQVLDRVLEPFFTTKSLGQGTGLGLSQIYGFVRQSGGALRIESSPGHGTTVRLWLPSSAQRPEAEKVAPGEAAPGAYDGGGAMLLLVDDEVGVREPAAARLRDLGYRVFEASDGPGALKLLKKGLRPRLLVTDIGMPGGMDGVRLAEAARSLVPDLSVLFVTGYATAAIPVNADVIAKPFALDTLTTRVRSAIGPAPSRLM